MAPKEKRREIAGEMPPTAPTEEQIAALENALARGIIEVQSTDGRRGKYASPTPPAGGAGLAKQM